MGSEGPIRASRPFDIGPAPRILRVDQQPRRRHQMVRQQRLGAVGVPRERRVDDLRMFMNQIPVAMGQRHGEIAIAFRPG